MSTYYIKTNRVFNTFRKFSWILVPLISLGGLYYPKLGLLVILIMFALMAIGIFNGKAWCGNYCPHGSLFDYLIMPISSFKEIPNFFKSSVVKWGFFAFYMVMFVRRVMKAASFWGTMQFWDKLGFLFVIQYLVMPTILGTILAITINPRTWCSFCPMGAMEELMYKLGNVLGVNESTDKRVSVEAAEKCHKCGTCARVCPMQLEPYLRFEDSNQFDEDKCIKCGTCVEHCPAEILTLSNAEKAAEIAERTDLTGYQNKRKIGAVIEEINQLDDGIKEYIFKLDEEVEYTPGQFILVKIMDEPEMYRAYSISDSDPEDKSRLRVTIQKVEGGYGTTIIDNEFEVGDRVELEGPMGDDLMIDKETEKVLLVAGGIGITPFVPITKDLAENENSIKDFKLLYGVNKPDDFLYDDYFAELASKSGKFEYIRTVANPDEDWEGYTGFVTDVLKQMDVEDYKIYMCGPRPMVEATLDLFEELNNEGREVDMDNIFYESA